MKIKYCKCKKSERILGCNGDMVKDFCRKCKRRIKGANYGKSIR